MRPEHLAAIRAVRRAARDLQAVCATVVGRAAIVERTQPAAGESKKEQGVPQQR